MKPHLTKHARWFAAGLLSVAATLSGSALTPAESSSVLYMKQEEKVARDVYQALFIRWEHATFGNIATAEQRHMDAIDGLIARYGLTDTTPIEPGRFSIPELQKLHDDLLAEGNLSLTEALRVGVKIEGADMADLKEAIGLTREPMIQRVFGNLLRASGHHLSAYQVALGGDGKVGCGHAAAGACPRGVAGQAPDGVGCPGVCGQAGEQCRAAGSGKGPSAACAKDGVCPAGQGTEGCGVTQEPSPTRAGTTLRRGRR